MRSIGGQGKDKDITIYKRGHENKFAKEGVKEET